MSEISQLAATCPGDCHGQNDGGADFCLDKIAERFASEERRQAIISALVQFFAEERVAGHVIESSKTFIQTAQSEVPAVRYYAEKTLTIIFGCRRLVTAVLELDKNFDWTDQDRTNWIYKILRGQCFVAGDESGYTFMPDGSFAEILDNHCRTNDLIRNILSTVLARVQFIKYSLAA